MSGASEQQAPREDGALASKWAKVEPDARRAHWFDEGQEKSACGQITRAFGSFWVGRALRCVNCKRAKGGPS